MQLTTTVTSARRRRAVVLVNDKELALIAALAKHEGRSQSELLRHLVLTAVEAAHMEGYRAV